MCYTDVARFVFCNHIKRYQYLRRVCESTTGNLVSHQPGKLLHIHQRDSNSIESYLILQMYLIPLFWFYLHHDSLMIRAEMSSRKDKDGGLKTHVLIVCRGGKKTR